MPNLEDLSVDDLKALKAAKQSGDLSGLSVEGLKTLKAIKSSSTPPPDKGGSLDAATLGVSQSLLLGGRPIVAGVGGALGNTIGMVKNSPRGLLDAVKNIPQYAAQGYNDARQEALAEQDKAAIEHPTANTIGQIGGSLATLPLMAAKGLKAAVVSSGALGAGQGALESVSRNEDAGDILKSAGVGGALGGTAALVGAGLGKGIEKAGESLKQAAESKAFKAAGAMLKDFRRVYGKDENKINELGRTILDHNLIAPGDAYKDIAVKGSAFVDDIGEKIGSIYNNVLETVTDSARLGQASPSVVRQIEESGFRPVSQRDEVLKSVEKFLRAEHPSNVTTPLAKVQSVLNDIEQLGDNLTPQQQLKIKKSLDSQINYDKDIKDNTAVQQALKKVRDFVSDKINKQVEIVDNLWPSPQAQELKRLNKLYGNGMEITNIAEDKALRESANNFFGLRDTIVGAGLGGVGGAAMGAGNGDLDVGRIIKGAGLGLAGGLASKVGRTYGPALGALGREALGNTLQTAAPLVAPALGTGSRAFIDQTNAVRRRMEQKNANNR